MISKWQITLIFHKSSTSNNRSQFFVADVTKMASIFKKYLGAFFFQKKIVLLTFGIIFSKLNVYSHKISKNIEIMTFISTKKSKLQFVKLKKNRKMHFFELLSHITFEILLMNHFKGVLSPCFTSFPIRKTILKHPKCF